MRTTIIPAQITTVEDKIAGSLNLTQILILMVPILITSIVYVLVPPSMSLTPLKLIGIITSILICITLVIRIKDKIIAEWLGVVVRYQLRPRFFLFNKNDVTSRIVDVPDIPSTIHTYKKPVKRLQKQLVSEPTVADLIKLEEMLGSGKVAVSYRLGGKRR